MKILFLGKHDWANRINRVRRALVGAGVDAHVATTNAHPHGYLEDWVFANGDEPKMREWIGDGVDWLISSGDGAYDLLLREVPRIPHKWFAAAQAGSQYRGASERINALDRHLKARIRFCSADHMHLSTDSVPKYPYWTAAETWRSPGEPRTIKVLHASNNKWSKGSDTLLAGARLAGIEPTVAHHRPHAEVLELMGQSSAYLDQLQASIGGFGSAAIEAAAMGCAVVSDMRKVPQEDWAPPFQRVCTVDDVARAVERALANPQQAERCYDWARSNASPRAVAKRWLRILEAHTTDAPLQPAERASA